MSKCPNCEKETLVASKTGDFCSYCKYIPNQSICSFMYVEQLEAELEETNSLLQANYKLSAELEKYGHAELEEKCKLQTKFEILNQFSSETVTEMRNTIHDQAAEIERLTAGLLKVMKLLSTIRKVACGEEQIDSDGSYSDTDALQWIYERINDLEQALKGKNDERNKI